MAKKATKIVRGNRFDQESAAVNSFSTMWASTNNDIERALKERGEVFVSGNDVFEAITTIIEENRRDRDLYERAMSETISTWSGAPGKLEAAE